MNVLQILAKLDIGGTEILTLDVCRKAKKHDVCIHLLTSSEGILFKEFQSTDSTIHIKKRSFFIDLSYIKYME